MNMIKDFEYYKKKGIVKKKSGGEFRAESLIKEASKDYNFLMEIVDKIGFKEEGVNSIIVNCYDIIMKIIRALMLRDGMDASGYGAHEAEVVYLGEIGFSRADVEFANQLRYFRNGIEYYGKSFSVEFAKHVVDFVKKLKGKLW